MIKSLEIIESKKRDIEGDSGKMYQIMFLEHVKEAVSMAFEEGKNEMYYKALAAHVILCPEFKKTKKCFYLNPKGCECQSKCTYLAEFNDKIKELYESGAELDEILDEK